MLSVRLTVSAVLCSNRFHLFCWYPSQYFPAYISKTLEFGFASLSLSMGTRSSSHPLHNGGYNTYTEPSNIDKRLWDHAYNKAVLKWMPDAYPSRQIVSIGSCRKSGCLFPSTPASSLPRYICRPRLPEIPGPVPEARLLPPFRWFLEEASLILLSVRVGCSLGNASPRCVS